MKKTSSGTEANKTKTVFKISSAHYINIKFPLKRNYTQTGTVMKFDFYILLIGCKLLTLFSSTM